MIAESIPPGPITVAGPSHARRYRNAVATGQIAPPRTTVNWMDLAAASMLHPHFEQASFSHIPEPTLCMVPDFRIGNRSLRDPHLVESYIGVAKELISEENDRKIYDRVMDRVRSIRDRNPEARFLFWCLGGRELQNRRSRNYIVDGAYRHPVWNIADVESDIGDQVISLQPIYGHPLGGMLHIDWSQHPSYIALELFRRITDRPEIGVGQHLDAIAEYVQRPVIVLPKNAVLTGDSFWLDALRLYVNRRLVTLGAGVEIRTPQELLDEGPHGRTHALYISGLRGGGGRRKRRSAARRMRSNRSRAEGISRECSFGKPVLTKPFTQGDAFRRPIHVLRAPSTAG